MISTHTLTWSVTNLTSCPQSEELNFNSHAHVERDKQLRVLSFENVISTHTLTWSVTLYLMTFFDKCIISTHTLTWSVTKLVATATPDPNISTHTLTWSVTRRH